MRGQDQFDQRNIYVLLRTLFAAVAFQTSRLQHLGFNVTPAPLFKSCVGTFAHLPGEMRFDSCLLLLQSNSCWNVAKKHSCLVKLVDSCSFFGFLRIQRECALSRHLNNFHQPQSSKRRSAGPCTFPCMINDVMAPCVHDERQNVVNSFWMDCDNEVFCLSRRRRSHKLDPMGIVLFHDSTSLWAVSSTHISYHKNHVSVCTSNHTRVEIFKLLKLYC